MTPDVIEQVAIASGQILHAGTGRSIQGKISITAAECPVIDKILDDGTFAISADIQAIFPRLASQNYRLSLTIRADSQQYIAGYREQGLVVPIPMGSTFDPPINLGVITFPADRVNIRGRVVEAKNPDTPISGASIELDRAGVFANTTTDNFGRYRFNGVAVLAGTKIRCSAANFKTVERTLVLDFGMFLNEEYFRLPPI